MPKKAIFTKEQVFETAFKVFKKNGIEGLSARNIATALGASPAPIYSFYSSLDILKDELLAEAKNLFLKYISEKRTELVFLNIGMGICIFAREEKELFQTIFLKETVENRRELIDGFIGIVKDEMSKDGRFTDLDENFKRNLYLDCWTYAYGFATLIATNYYTEITDDIIRERLMEAAGVMIYKRLENYKK